MKLQSARSFHRLDQVAFQQHMSWRLTLTEGMRWSVKWRCSSHQERNVLLRVGAPKKSLLERPVEVRPRLSAPESLPWTHHRQSLKPSGCRAWLSSWRGDLSLVGQILWERVRKLRVWWGVPQTYRAPNLWIIMNYIHYHWITMDYSRDSLKNVI